MVKRRHSDSQLADARTIDTTFEALREPRRRYAVRVLAERDSSIALSELAAAVARRESESASDAVPADAADEISSELHHVHLPELADAGLVEYDAEAGTVAPTGLEAVRPLLSVAEDVR